MVSSTSSQSRRTAAQHNGLSSDASSVDNDSSTTLRSVIERLEQDVPVHTVSHPTSAEMELRKTPFGIVRIASGESRRPREEARELLPSRPTIAHSLTTTSLDPIFHYAPWLACLCRIAPGEVAMRQRIRNGVIQLRSDGTLSLHHSPSHVTIRIHATVPPNMSVWDATTEKPLRGCPSQLLLHLQERAGAWLHWLSRRLTAAQYATTVPNIAKGASDQVHVTIKANPIEADYSVYWLGHAVECQSYVKVSRQRRMAAIYTVHGQQQQQQTETATGWRYTKMMIESRHSAVSGPSRWAMVDPPSSNLLTSDEQERIQQALGLMRQVDTVVSLCTPLVDTNTRTEPVKPEGSIEAWQGSNVDIV